MTPIKTPVDILTSPITVETSTHWITSNGTKHKSMKEALQANILRAFAEVTNLEGEDGENHYCPVLPGDLITWLQNNRELVGALYELFDITSPSVSPFPENPQQ